MGDAHRESENVRIGSIVVLCYEFERMMRIPAKANAVPKGSRTVFRAEADHLAGGGGSTSHVATASSWSRAKGLAKSSPAVERDVYPSH